MANETKNKVETGQWLEALIDYSFTQSIILEKTCNVDFYNILIKKKCNSSLSLKDLLFFNEGISF